jgi:transposase
MKFYGVDLHTDSFKVCSIDENNNFAIQKINLNSKEYVNFLLNLNKEDYIAVESCSNAFWFHDEVREKAAECFIINNWKFNDIAKSNKKTDKIDSKKIAKKLKYRVLTNGDDEDLPTVYVPIKSVRDLRTLFTTYEMFKKELVMVKNRIYSLMVQCGRHFEKNIFTEIIKESILKLELSEAIKFQIEMLFDQIDYLNEQLKRIKVKIVNTGTKIFANEIDKLISIKGISLFIAIGIMSDIADIKRFSSSKKLASYLRTAPKIDSSNKTQKIGCINRQSRKLSLSLLTQSLIHIIGSNNYINNFYCKKKASRKTGRARVAVARKTITMIYRMLTDNTYYRWVDENNYLEKKKEMIKILENTKKSA